MKLTDLTRKIASLQKAAEKRLDGNTDDQLTGWLQGYISGLNDVADIVKREYEIERAEQRLAKLKSDQSEEPEPDWTNAPETAAADSPSPANNNAEQSAAESIQADRKAA